MKIKTHMYAYLKTCPTIFPEACRRYRNKATVSRYSVFRKCKSNYKWRK